MEYKSGQKVAAAHSAEVINRAIAIPKVLQSDDGRRVHIVDWNASVPMGDAVKVSVSCLVSLSEEKQDE